MSTALQPDAGRQGTIFCVDCSKGMFEVNEEDKKKRTHMVIALKAIRSEMNKICLSADLRQMVGIIFFNTAKTNIASEALDNIFVYRKMLEFKQDGFMNSLNAEAVMQIDALINDEETRNDFFEKTLGGPGLCDYSQLIWLAQRSFRYDIKAQKKAAFIFTLNSFMSDYDEVTMARVKLEIDNAKAAEIELTHMLFGGEEPNDHWYRLDVEAEMFDPEKTFADSIKRRNISRRPIVSALKLHLGNQVEFPVSVFYPFGEHKLETGVYLNEKTNNVVNLKTRHVVNQPTSDVMNLSDIIGEEESAEPAYTRVTVDPKKIHLVQNIGGTEVKLDPKEFKNFKRIDAPGLHVIGFKPMKYLKDSHVVGPSQYLYPNEKIVNGSSCLYRALYSRCLLKDVFILARFVLKTNTMPKLVALVPQRKGNSEANETAVENLFYEGFHVIHLPFSQDKRNLQEKIDKEWDDATEDQVNAAQLFIKKLTAPYSPENFSNPVLQKHYWVLEGLATNNDDYEADHQWDQIKPYYEKADRGKRELNTFQAELS